jgi:DNA binding protein with HTH domain
MYFGLQFACRSGTADDPIGGHRGGPEAITIAGSQLAPCLRASSAPPLHLSVLLDYVLARPIAFAGVIAKELGITPRAAQDLVAELDYGRQWGGDDTGHGAFFEIRTQRARWS